MNTQHPEKWRETCDPFSFHYHHFQLDSILGYPHAGNDVFYVRGFFEGNIITAYIKAARRTDAAIENEVNILSRLHDSVFPRIIDHDSNAFSVTTAMPGARLSVIVEDNTDLLSLSYMEEYGEALARLHKINISAEPQKDRRFYQRPSDELLDKLDLSFLKGFFAKMPAVGKTVFCHGDFHYANVLWKDGHISAILDFELAGYGNRDFDIAWALFLRPGQKFLKTKEELDLFLKGYKRYGDYNTEAIQYYMAQCYVYFLTFCQDDEEYCRYVRNWLSQYCQ